MRVLVATLLFWAVCATGQPANPGGSGVIVKSVTPGSAVARAGIVPGDVLTGWVFADAADDAAINTISHPFDITELEIEQHPLRSVVLHGERDGVPVTIEPGLGRWRLRLEPRWNETDRAAFLALDEQLRGDELELGISAARAMAARLYERGDQSLSAWLLSYGASALTAKRLRARADGLYREAIAAADAPGSESIRAHLMYLRGVSLMRLSRFDEASETLGRAIDLHNTISPTRLGIAGNARVLGAIETQRSNFSLAEDHLRMALALQEEQVPESLIVADTLGTLGRLGVTQGKLAEAEAHYRRAVAIGEVLEPGGGAHSSYLNGLAIVFHSQGDEAAAESVWLRALALEEAIEPGSRDVAFMMHNIGLVKYERGDFRESESLYRRSLAILEQRVPGSLEVARTLNNLGSLALEQGNLAAADNYHSQAYAIRQAVAPDSLDLAFSLMNLANVARQRGYLDQARLHYQDALRTHERLAPNTAQSATIWVNIGILEEDLGHRDEALAAYEKALRIYAGLSPAGRGVAETLTRMGNHALTQKRFGVARQHFDKALSIFDMIAPQTYQQAQVFYGLARVSRENGDVDAAVDNFQKSLLALESQHSRLGGTDESKAVARARYLEPYKEFVEYLLEIGEPERAFDILERSRSRVLLNLLSERDLVFNTDVPEALERQRRVLARSYEKSQAQLYASDSLDRAAEWQTELRAIRRQQEDVERQIGEQSPRLAELQYGTPLSLEDLRGSLSRGTAVLSYNVGRHRTQVFAVSPQGALESQSLPLGAEDIDALVTRFRYLIDAGRWDKEPSDALMAHSMSLYQRLVLPLEPALEHAERILVVPDGALNVLPFAALVRGGTNTDRMYLAEWKPSLVVNSLTVQAQLQEARSSRTRSAQLVAFGDPDYSAAANSAETAQSGPSRSSLGELPWSREEVLNIAKVHGADSKIYIGSEATEERVKSLRGDYRYVHFAAHALLNEQVPLDTAIALAVPGGPTDDAENGFLQVWEVYESLRLNVDLVTLSGCETGLGANYAGEGLIGLTRAFQYAGASSVLASLWSVNDRSTSRLMTQLYSNLANGLPQDKALQRTQVSMIQGIDGDDQSWWRSIRAWVFDEESITNTRHPYRWAGFVLNGAGQ